MKLSFIWIQWCGKGTQARLLAQKYNFLVMDMWKELRKLAETNTDLWKEIKETIDAWNLVTPSIVEDVMKELLEWYIDKNLILDWFVRSNANRDSLEKILQNKDYTFILFDLSEEKAKQRLLWRMYDKETWDTFPYWITHHPVSWTELIKRIDDNEDSILKRLEEFKKITKPFALKQKNLIVINANQDIDSVFSDLEYKLDLK